MSIKQINASGLTFLDITHTYQVNCMQLINSNPDKEDYLTEKWLSQEPFDQDTFLIIKDSNTGGLDNLSTPDKVIYQASQVNSRYHVYGSDIIRSGCYYIEYAGSSVNSIWSLPTFPNEFNDSNGADFNSTSVLGRSVAYQTYNNSSRSVSFNLTLHDELVGNNYDYVHDLVAAIESACYPEYNEGIVNPPEVQFVIGKQFVIRGILTQCSASWKAPIIDNRLVNCDLSLGITETTGPYSMSEIKQMGGHRI